MTAEQQLTGFIAKFAPPNRRLIRALRKAMRKRLPGANELVYDNYNFLVIAYCPTQKPSESYFSVGADKNGANLFFGYNGSKLADSKMRLQGKGALNRFVRLESEASLASVDDLISQAVAISKEPAQQKGQLVIRMISPTQRPRR